jgi:hypothetical protein
VERGADADGGAAVLDAAEGIIVRKQVVGSTFYFLETPKSESEVLAWFSALSEAPEASAFDWGTVLHFRHLGPLILADDGSIDATLSPVVTFFPPRQVRGVFWTAGEVRFLTKGRTIPRMDALVRVFRSWIKNFEIVFEQRLSGCHDWDHYLEGSIQNVAPVIYALPSGREALSEEQYFISHRDAGCDLSILCRKLHLRGVVCC